MQEMSANEESDEEISEPGDEIQLTITDEVADLIEKIEVENVELHTEETGDQNAGSGLLFENARITVGESLLLTMAFIMRHKLSMVASDDLISLLELHCPSLYLCQQAKGLIFLFVCFYSFRKREFSPLLCCTTSSEVSPQCDTMHARPDGLDVF